MKISNEPEKIWLTSGLLILGFSILGFVLGKLMGAIK